MSSSQVILAFESSCDETAVALVDENADVLFEKVYSQIEIHQKFGGVVPEVASRSHFEKIDQLGSIALDFIKQERLDLTAVAATQGPGLIGALLVGSSYAQGIASGFGVPFVGVHHLRGHIASALLADSPANCTAAERAQKIFPALVLLVSGGHTQILHSDSQLRVTSLIGSVDDAAGECFDKTAKLMGLPYPGGPQIEAIARSGGDLLNERRKDFLKTLPRPRTKDGDFSFSGLKTSVRTSLEKNPHISRDPDFCWALQETIAEVLEQGLDRSLSKLKTSEFPRHLVFCGGVSANQRIRHRMNTWASTHQMPLHLAPIKFCTDNAAMIGAAAWVQHSSFNETSSFARKALI